MKRTIIILFMLVLMTGVVCGTASTAGSAYITSLSGSDAEASLGDILTLEITDIPDPYTFTWYCDGKALDELSDTLTVTAPYLGKTISASVSSDDKTVVSNEIRISPEAPTLSLNVSGGDYCAILTWTVSENGAPVTHYDVTYTASDTPDAFKEPISLEAGTSSYTINGLSGDTEYIVRLIAYSSAGSTAANYNVTPNDPDLASVTAAKLDIETHPITLHMKLGNTRDAILSYLTSYYKSYVEFGVTVSEVVVTSFTEAEEKTAENQSGKAGSFTFIVEIGKGDVRLTTKVISGVVDNSTSLIYVTADRYTCDTGGSVLITSQVIDIAGASYQWYRADYDNAEGTAIEGAFSATYTLTSDKEQEYWYYCVCGTVKSNYVKITFTRPFIPVTIVSLSSSVMTAGEAFILPSVIQPSDASVTSIIWSIKDDGGCGAHLTGRTLQASESGVVTVTATIVSGGIDEKDYIRDFNITVNPAFADTETEAPVTENPYKMTVIECPDIDGVESVTFRGTGAVQLTSVTEETINTILSDSYAETPIVTAVKFAYDEGALANDVSLQLGREYASAEFTVITVNLHGASSSTVRTADESGSIMLNTVSPDIIVVLSSMPEKKDTSALFMTAGIAVPTLTAACFAAYIAYEKEKRADNERKARKAASSGSTKEHI